jgi:small subunit ribosomal protein S9
MTAKTASKTKAKKAEETKKTAAKPASKAKVAAKSTTAKETKPTKTAQVEQKTSKAVEKPVAPAESKKVVKPEARVESVQPKSPTTPKTSIIAGNGTPVAHGVGRRKAAVARVWLRRNGSGKMTVNSLPAQQYFSTDTARRIIKVPALVAPAVAARYDVDVNVYGGGVHGQADAIKLALSRALVKADESIRPALKEKGLLRVDARVVERKKYGQKKARRRFQFVKR